MVLRLARYRNSFLRSTLRNRPGIGTRWHGASGRQPGVTAADDMSSVIYASSEDSPAWHSQVQGAVITTAQDAAPPTFNMDAFLSTLSTSSFGRTLLSSKSTASTQTFMYQNRAVMPPGAAYVADEQVAGRGRAGNVWTSPRGCLMFSLLFKSSMPGDRVPFVQYVACLAVVASLQRIFSGRLGTTASPSTFPVKIKWPNDIYAAAPPGGGDALKIGGILCQSCNFRGRFDVVVGVGLNVDNSAPTTCVNQLLAAAAAARGVVVEATTREEVLATFLNDFEALIQELESNGFGALAGTYQRYWMHQNQEVSLQDPDDPSVQTLVTIVGLTSGGYLRAVDARGQEVELHPDGNSLDMMRGLIKRKIPA